MNIIWSEKRSNFAQDVSNNKHYALKIIERSASVRYQKLSADVSIQKIL